MPDELVAIVSRVTRNLPGWDEAIARAKADGYRVFEAIGTGTTLHDLPDEIAAEVTGVVISTEPVDSVVLQRLPRLRAVACIGSGMDHVDVAAAEAAGVSVTAGTGGNAWAVADHALAMLLSLARGLPVAQDNVLSGRGWTPWPPIIPRDVRDLTLGVVGFGAIGRTVADRALRLGVAGVLFSDPIVDSAPPGLDARRVELGELLGSADVVSVHVPLLPATRGLIGAAEIARMRPGAFLLNLSRGGVIDEDATYAALERGDLAGAGLDVFAHEGPTAPAPPRLPNLITTPHMAGLSDRVATETRLAAVERLLAALRRAEPAVS